MEKESLSPHQRIEIIKLAKCFQENKPFFINCFFGVWDIKTFSSDKKIYDEIIRERENCSFYEIFQENMSLKTAEHNLDIKKQNFQTKTINKTTIIASIIGAIIGSLITVFLSIFTK